MRFVHYLFLVFFTCCNCVSCSDTNTREIPYWQSREQKNVMLGKLIVIPDVMMSKHFGISGLVCMSYRFRGGPFSSVYGIGPSFQILLMKIHLFVFGVEHFLSKNKVNRFLVPCVSLKVQFPIFMFLSILGGLQYNFGRAFYSTQFKKIAPEFMWFVGLGISLGVSKISVGGYLVGGKNIIRI